MKIEQYNSITKEQAIDTIEVLSESNIQITNKKAKEILVNLANYYEKRNCLNCSLYSESYDCIVKKVNFLNEVDFHCNEWKQQ